MEQSLKKIEEKLSSMTIPRTSITQNRLNFPERHRRMILGITKARFKGTWGLSSCSKKYPELYKMIMEFGNTYIPIPFNAIHINHNVVCPKHIDKKNAGVSAIVSCGQYTGCQLMIEGVHHETYYNIITFNGSEKEHWNTDDLEGSRYSLIFYWVEIK